MKSGVAATTGPGGAAPAEVDWRAQAVPRDPAGTRGGGVAAAYDQHAPAIARHLERLLNDREEAQEVLQETFYRLLRDPRPEAAQGRSKAYIFQVATNLARDRLRRRHRTARIFAAGPLEDVSTGGPGPERAAMSQRSVEQLTRALRALPERTRHILLLHRFDQMTYEEIARSLAISTRTVERHMSAAVDHLQRIAGEFT